MRAVDMRLYGVLDPERAHGRDLATVAAAAAAGGCTLIQYRDKKADTRTFVTRARALKAALKDTKVPLLINDRVDVALATGADGVHVGQEDMHPSDARRLLGPGAIIGITIKTPAQADELFRLPVDYACIGGVFASASKDNPGHPIGLDGLGRIIFRAHLAAAGTPVAAIAGIDAMNAASVIGAGADGVAVISAVFAADDVEGAARGMRAIVDRALAARGTRP
jgi:thiamine-phosphate pyrophosphorylase